MTPETLISPAYRDEQIRLHQQPRGYGGKGKKWATAVQSLVWVHGCASVLDYGCGEGSLITYLQAVNREDQMRCKDFPPRCRDFREYDPAIDGKDALPDPADLVVCTDVLEHIEPEKLSAVLQHLKALARKVLLLVIATRPSGKTLSDGRNAHLILESAEWWGDRLRQAGLDWKPGPDSPLAKPSRELVAVVVRP
jgi:hypothetical protein